MRINDALLRADANNFTLVRLILASAVIITHSYWLVTGIEGADSFSGFLGKPISYFAVDGFFFLSGFLVYASLLRRANVINFLVARFARIWPALAVSVVLTTIFGLLFTSVGIRDYLGGETRSFLVDNLLLQSGRYNLTAVQCGTELCNVNGSLWTIAWEVRCYVLLALLFPLGLASEKMMKRFVLPATLAYALIWHILPLSSIEAKGVFYYLDMADRLWTMFALGIAAYIFRRQIILKWWVAVILLVAAIAETHLGLNVHAKSLFAGYAVLCAGVLTARRGAIAGTWPDYSYGMYIYAFPVMMLVGYLWHFSNPLALATVNALATVPLAMLSWHYLEAPMLALVKRWSKRRTGVVVAQAS